MGDDVSEDVDSFILNSKYRRDVLTYLAVSSPATPTEIADNTASRRPHVSRALSELRERDVVELRVSERKSVGRYYALTETGEAAWDRLKDDLREVNWKLTEPATEADREVIRLAKEEFGDSLRMIGTYDGDRIDVIHADQDVLDSYTDEEFERGLRTLVFEHSIRNFSFPTGEFRSEVKEFTAFVVIRVYLSEERQISISCEPTENIRFPAFARRAADTYAEHTD